MDRDGKKKESPPIKPVVGVAKRDVTPPTIDHVVVSPTNNGGVEVTPYTDTHSDSDNLAIYAVPRSLLSKQETTPTPEPIPTSDKGQRASEPAQGVQYRAIFDYETSDPSEVNLRVGDIVTSDPSVTAPPGWLMITMETSGDSGWTPESYLEILTEKTTQESQVATNQEVVTCESVYLYAVYVY